MKKIITLLMAGVMVFALTACSSGDDDTQTNTKDPSVNQNADDPTSGNPDDLTSGNPDDLLGDATSGNPDDLLGETPSVDPGLPSDTIIDVNEAWASMQDLISEDEKVGGMELDAQMVTDIYTLDETLVSQVFAVVPMMSGLIDETIIVEAVDGKLEDVQALIMARQQALVGSAFYPEHVDFVADYKMSTRGNFVIFSVGHHAETYVNAFNDMFA